MIDRIIKTFNLSTPDVCLIAADYAYDLGDDESEMILRNQDLDTALETFSKNPTNQLAAWVAETLLWSQREGLYEYPRIALASSEEDRPHMKSAVTRIYKGGELSQYQKDLYKSLEHWDWENVDQVKKHIFDQNILLGKKSYLSLQRIEGLTFDFLCPNENYVQWICDLKPYRMQYSVIF